MAKHILVVFVLVLLELIQLMISLSNFCCGNLFLYCNYVIGRYKYDSS